MSKTKLQALALSLLVPAAMAALALEAVAGTLVLGP